MAATTTTEPDRDVRAAMAAITDRLRALRRAVRVWLLLDGACALVTLAVAVIGLRWGSIAGAYLGALGGLVPALLTGEAPFAATAAMSLAGLIAGELPERFVIESHRAVAVAVMVVALAELIAVHLLKGLTPQGGTNAAVWAAGWAVVVGPLLHRLVVRLTTPPPAPRLPMEP